MPELTVIHFGLLVAMLLVGAIIGWIVRADRCAKEKIAVNASWQDQLESQQSEHNRLAEQNKSLMEQISQYQAAQKDYANRAKELSESLKEAFAKRDELQRQLKDLRGNLDVAIAQRDRLRSNQQKNPEAQAAALKEKNDKIFNLSRELTSWQSRVPPLVERFQEKSKEVAELEAELEKAQVRLQALEELDRSDQTRIEPVDADSLPDGGDASNEPNALTSSHDASKIQDQIDEDQIDEDPVAEDANDEIVSVGELVEPIDLDSEDVVVVDQEFGAVFSNEDDQLADDNDAARESANIDGNSDAADEEETAGPDSADEDDAAGSESGNQHDSVSADGTERDDLKKIKGIGPAIEKTLNELEVYRYHQIAEMSEYDIDRVAQQLKGFRSRIYREDWIGQARDLQYDKANNRD